MRKIRNILKSRFSGDDTQADEDLRLRGMLDRGFHLTRDSDPDTSMQWLRLRRAMSENAADTRPIRVSPFPRLAYAALFLALASAGVYLYVSNLHQEGPETFSTLRGQHTTLLLRDSSEVTLNAASELVVRPIDSGEPRRVSLKGEAFFNVRHNQTPFIVATEGAEVRVVGTEFNVRAREGKLEVAVMRGSVNVVVSNNVAKGSLLLSQYQIAQCEPGGVPRLVGTMPMNDYPGWMHGKIHLNKSTLPDVCREIEIRFGITVNVKAGDVHQQMTGVLDARSADAALRALCELTGKQYTRDDKEFTLY